MIPHRRHDYTLCAVYYEHTRVEARGRLVLVGTRAWWCSALGLALVRTEITDKDPVELATCELTTEAEVIRAAIEQHDVMVTAEWEDRGETRRDETGASGT